MCPRAGMIFGGILKSSIRALMLIVLSLANMDNGHSSATGNRSDDFQPSLNQNLITLPSIGIVESSANSDYLPPILTLPSFYHLQGLPGPANKQHQQHQYKSSGSSIISFDSSNLIDERRQQREEWRQQQLQPHQHFQQFQQQPHIRLHQHQQQQQYQHPSNSRQSDRHSMSHKVVDLEGDSVENRLDVNTPDDGAENDVYRTPMYFGTENSTVITTQIGATAHMPCTVHHIGDGVVSWIRKKDYHLLTVGLTTYSSDERFSATHLKHSEDWTLQIRFVQLRDAGVYECQVSTHPPTSIYLHLNVVEARAEISGPPIRYLTPGSTLRLQCHVVQNTEASEFIFWYHDNRMINYDIDRGINVSMEPDFQSSELTISRTRREHSGNFTCVASNTQPASVLVHIFKGDNPAAMYHGHVGSSTKSYQSHLYILVILIVSGYRVFRAHLHQRMA